MPKMRLHVERRRRVVRWLSMDWGRGPDRTMGSLVVERFLPYSPKEELYRSQYLLGEWPASPPPPPPPLPLPPEKPVMERLTQALHLTAGYLRQQEMLDDPRPMYVFQGSRRRNSRNGFFRKGASRES